MSRAKEAYICLYTGIKPENSIGEVVTESMWAGSRLIFARNVEFSRPFNLENRKEHGNVRSFSQTAERNNKISFDFSLQSGDPILGLTGDITCALHIDGINLMNCYLDGYSFSLSAESDIRFRASFTSYGKEQKYTLTDGEYLLALASGSFDDSATLYDFNSAFAELSTFSVPTVTGVLTSFSYSVQCERAANYTADERGTEVTLSSISKTVDFEMPHSGASWMAYDGEGVNIQFIIKNTEDVPFFVGQITGVLSSADFSHSPESHPLSKFSIQEFEF